MENEKVEQLHITIPITTKERLSQRQIELGFDSLSATTRNTINKGLACKCDGEITQKKTDIKTYFMWGIFIPLFLLVAGRINNNDPILLSLGVMSLAGVVILSLSLRK